MADSELSSTVKTAPQPTPQTSLLFLSGFRKLVLRLMPKHSLQKKKEIKDNLLRRTKGYILMYFYIFSDMKTFKRRQ